MSQYDNQSIASSSMNSVRTDEKVEALIQKFKKMDKDADGSLTKSEVSTFLKQNSNPKNPFDPRFEKELLKYLGYSNEVNEITVETFIDGFLNMDKMMQNKLLKINSEIPIIENKLEESKKECIQYRDEKLNSEGFCENSRILFTIVDIDMDESIQDMRTISIILKYNNNQKVIEFSPGRFDEQEKERVEFKPQRKSDAFHILLRGTDEKGNQRDFGEQKLNLEPNENQEEYELEILIPGLADEKTILAKIKANILFYYSDYVYYENKMKQVKKELSKAKEKQKNLMKVNDGINEIYGFSSKKQNLPRQGSQNSRDIQQNFDVEGDEYSEGKKGDKFRKGGQRNPNENNFDSNQIYDSNNGLVDFGDLKMPDLNEDLPPVKEGNEVEKYPPQQPNEMMQLRKLSYVLLASSALSALYKPDFINGFIGVFLYILTSEMNIPFFKNLIMFLYADLGALGFNLIWLLCNLRKKEEYGDNSLRGFAVFLTLITGAVEGYLGYNVYKKMKENKN